MKMYSAMAVFEMLRAGDGSTPQEELMRLRLSPCSSCHGTEKGQNGHLNRLVLLTGLYYVNSQRD